MSNLHGADSGPVSHQLGRSGSRGRTKGRRSMRKTLFLVLVLVSCLAAAAGAQTFVGVMNGTNEAPGPGDADGFGLAGFRFEGTSVAFTIMVKNIATPTASHIHRGAAGVAGPVVITLASSFPNNTASGTANASAALIDEVRHNLSGFYVNVHNADFPNGAIRAQLSDGAFAFATGANEAPGPGDADGSGMAVFIGSGSNLNYAAMVQSIDAPSASHVHRGAAGVPGSVVITLASSYPDNMATGTVTIADTLIQEIVGNPTNFYFNVHNAAFPNGAIRGQLALAPYTEAHYFPIVGKVDGLNNTRYVADVRVVNRSSETENVTLEFFPGSSAGLSAFSSCANKLQEKQRVSGNNAIISLKMNLTIMTILPVQSFCNLRRRNYKVVAYPFLGSSMESYSMVCVLFIF
jgi:hypothetical protein